MDFIVRKYKLFNPVKPGIWNNPFLTEPFIDALEKIKKKPWTNFNHKTCFMFYSTLYDASGFYGTYCIVWYSENMELILEEGTSSERYETQWQLLCGLDSKKLNGHK